MNKDEQDQPPAYSPPTRGGETYPLDHVIAMIDDEPSARAAAEAVAADGVLEEEIHLITGQELLQIERAIDDRRSLWNRIVELYPSDERQIINDYKKAAEKGGFFFAVYAPNTDRRDRVRDVLKGFGGYHMHHFSNRTYTDL